MNKPQKAIWGLISVLAFVGGLGCDALFYDLDEKDFLPQADLGGENDMSDMSAPDDMDVGVADMNDAGTPDMSDMSDMANMPDMIVGPGQICMVGGELIGSCDPITQDCEPGRVCDFFFNVGEARLETGCNPNADIFVIPEGAACMGMMDKCEPGLFCAQGICQRMCDRDTGDGCATDEFCKVFDDVLSVGYCSDSCN